MEAYRLARAPYASSLSGKGAAIKGARWNSPGVELLYSASNRSLAMAEVAVHFTLATLPNDYVMVTLYIPDGVSITTLPAKVLPHNWNSFPHPPSTQALGDAFIAEGTFCILKTPSAVTSGDYNLLINPRHAEFKGIRILNQDPFPFDKRIFKE